MLARLLLALTILLLAAFTIRDVAHMGGAAPWQRTFDLVDFYCAGHALDTGGDPYRYEPLHTCEHHNANGLSIYASPALAVPAPLPPYDLAPYRLLAMLSFPDVRAIDIAATVLVFVASVAALAAIGVALDVAVIALVLPIGYVELASGEIATFAFLALAVCGAALVKRRDTAAGIAAALLAVEPHIALPAIVALALFAPRARLALAAALAALGAVAIVTSGVGGTAEYLGAVLPAHAVAEALNPQQYSATYAAWFAGIGRAQSVLIGTLAYLAASALGIYAAHVQRDSAGARRALLVFAPAACAIAGGAFVHAEELCFAIPAALVIATQRTGTARSVAAAALCVLTVPWLAAWSVKRLFAASVLACVLLLWRLRIAFAPALATVAAIASLLYAFELHPPELRIALPMSVHYAADTLVQREWVDVMNAIATHDPLWLAIKLPVWLALLALIALATQPSRSTTS